MFHGGQNRSTITIQAGLTNIFSVYKTDNKPPYLEFKSPRATSPPAETSFSQRPDYYIFTVTVFTYLTAKKPPHLVPTEKVLTCPLSKANMHSPAL